MSERLTARWHIVVDCSASSDEAEVETDQKCPVVGVVGVVGVGISCRSKTQLSSETTSSLIPKSNSVRMIMRTLLLSKGCV